MSNSPRYIGFLDAPYNVTLTDDSGAAINLTGCTSNSFSLTMINQNTGLALGGKGAWTVTNATTGQAAYQYASADLATAGLWLHYVTVKLPSEPSLREFDPDPIMVLAGTVGAGAAPPGVLPAPAAAALIINVRDYGAFGDGSDQSIAIATALSAASNTGGIVFFPPGTYLTGPQTLYSNVSLIGSGIGATVIKLKNGANTDLFSAYTSSINLAGTVFTGSATGVTQFGLSNLTLDGNKANQTAGPSYPLRFYGYSCTLQNLEIKNGYTGGILCDWNNTPDPSGISVISHWRDVEVHDCNGIGIQTGGPTDQQWISVNSYKNTSHSYHFAPNAVGFVLVNCHGWEQTHGNNAVCMLIEAGGTKLVNCQTEGSDVCQVVLVGNDNEIHGGEVFAGFNGNSATGIQIGQTAGNTPYPGQIKQSAGVTTAVQVAGTMINTKIDNCVGAAIDYQNEINSDVTALIWANSGNVLKSGRSPNYVDRIFHNVNGTTPDGSLNTCPRYAYGGAGFNMFTLLGANGTPLLNANGTNNILSIANSTKLYGYSDYYTTQTYSVDMATGNIVTSGSAKIGNSATLYSGSGVPSNAVGSNGDYYFRNDTPGTANQRIYTKASGSWIGIEPTPPFALYDGELAQTSSSAGVANTVYLVGVPLAAPATLTNIRVRFAIGGNGHYDVGIYDSSGTNAGPGNLLAHAAATATSLVTSAATLTPAMISNVSLAPGRYWLALWIDNATDTFNKQSASGSMSVIMSGTNAGPLPALGSSLTGLANASLKPLLIGLLSGGWS